MGEVKWDYPEIVHLRPSAARRILLIAISSLFTLGGWLMVGSGDTRGWFVFIGFGLGLLVSLVMSLPGAMGMVVMKEGFAIRSMYRTRFYTWDEVSEFGVFKIYTGHGPAKKMVGFSGPTSHRRMAMVSAIVSGGYTHTLPETYGISAEELAARLNAYRAQARTEPT